MENRNKILGINKKVINAFHKVMLVAFLHSSIVAPSQNLIVNYINYKKPLPYVGTSFLEEIDEINNDELIKKEEKIKGDDSFKIKNNNSRFNTNSISYVLTPDISEGVIGVSKSRPLDDATDNLFRFNIKELPKENVKVFLTYELYGVQDFNGVSRSINDRYSTGGYIVKKQNKWSFQKEELDIKWFTKGENKILFSIPKNANLQYQVKNVKLEFDVNNEEKLSTALVVNSTDINYIKNNKFYLKGLLKNFNDDVKVFVEQTPLTFLNGEFEGFFTLSQEIRDRKFVMINAYDDKGLLGQQIVSLDFLVEADDLYEIENVFESISKFVKAKTNVSFITDGASLIVNDSALAEDKEISLLKLRKVDIAPMSSGMINVTKGGFAYRFLPDGTKFMNPVSIELEYDEKLLPKGYSHNDIKTFYFNTNSKSWVAVDRDSINTENKTIFSSTNHFTDYINGIIQTPESPETAGFTPTMMNDIKAVDPSSEMTIISPPEVSQKGDANISYPIKIPAGRNGIQPQLAVQYSNEGGNGWLGQGWNINTPAISIDTRWGTPLLDPIYESEIYTLNGEQLMYENILNSENPPKYVNWMPNRHYDAVSGNTSIFSTIQRPRITNAIFTPRKQGSFAKIERLGTNPTNYYWKVTNTDGTINWYGGNENGVEPNAVIKNNNDDIVHWGLFMVEDVFKNIMKYEYDNNNENPISGQTGLNQNLNDGIVFHVKKILYTGYNGTDYGYQVSFVNNPNYREDISINGRLGIKQVEPYFLNNIEVKQTNSSDIIRKYQFNIGYGKFKKGRLESVSELDKNDTVFYTHTFEYYDDLDQGGTDVYFSSGITQTICNDVPPPPCDDDDGDGVCNNVDACLNEPGPASNNGCPIIQICTFTNFQIPTSQFFRYKSDPLSISQNHFGGTVCKVNSNRIQSLSIDNINYDATIHNIYLIHGSGNDPAISRCPTYQIGATYDPITRNLEYDTRIYNYLVQLFSSQNVDIYGIGNNSIGQSRVVDNTYFRNYTYHSFYFFSQVDMNLSYIQQSGNLNNNSIDWISQSYFNTPIVKLSANLNVNIQIFLNNATTALGTYDLNISTQFNQFQTDLNTQFPGTTATMLPNNQVSITSSNPSIQSIQVVPINSNVSNSFPFLPCNSAKQNNISDLNNDWKNLKLSKTETEYGINRWIADGKELELPIDDLIHTTVFDFTDNTTDSSITGTFVLNQEKGKNEWQDEKGNTIVNNETIQKLILLSGLDLDAYYNELNRENTVREIKNRKENIIKANQWLNNYYATSNRATFRKNTQSEENNILKYKSKFSSNSLFSPLNPYNSFLNNFSVSYYGSFGDSNCPSFLNFDFLVPGNIPSFNSAAAILGSSKSKNYSVGGQIGIGIGWNPVNKLITVGKKFSYSWDQSESLSAIIDINGDGLDDIVYKQGSNLYWKKHTITRTYDTNDEPVITHSFDSPYALISSLNNDITDFYRSKGESSSRNTEINIGFTGASGFVGWEKSKNKSKSTMYFTDANADGLMDIVNYGTVYFNRIDSNGNPYFEPESKDTENMLIVAEPVTVAPPTEDLEVDYPNYDVVKVWEAPADGEIQIENTIELTDLTKEAIITIEKQKEFVLPYCINSWIDIYFDTSNVPNNVFIYLDNLLVQGSPYNMTLQSQRDLFVTNFTNQFPLFSIIVNSNLPSSYSFNIQTNSNTYDNSIIKIVGNGPTQNNNFINCYISKNSNSLSTCSYQADEMCLLFGAKLDTTNPLITNVINTNSSACNSNQDTLVVNKGDRIYFRTHAVANGNPIVDWDPKVSYVNTSLLSVNDQNGLQPYSSNYSDGFILSQELPVVFPSNNGGTAQITWDPITVNNPTDEITYEIIQRLASESSNSDNIIFSQIISANTTNGSVVPNTSLSSINIGINSNPLNSTTQFLFRVTSSSNVNWKVYEWKPKVVFTTPQAVIGTLGAEGNVMISETKYPIVNYSIYKPYVCGDFYQSVDISQIFGGTNLSIFPSVANSLFTATDNGVLNFVVKRDNTLVGKRTITVTNGIVSISPSTSISLGNGTSSLIEVGFYTDDSQRAIDHPTDISLLQKISNSIGIADISDGTSTWSINLNEVNLMHKPIGLFGPMYRQWGQFLYNPAKATNAINVPSLGVNLIKEEDLTITQSQAQTLQDLLVNIDGSGNITGPSSTLSNLANIDVNSTDLNALELSIEQVLADSGYGNFPFMVANPKRDFENNGYIEKWIGLHDENYASAFSSRAANMSQSFTFQDDINISQASTNTGAYGIDKISKGNGNSYSGGGGLGIINASGSISNGGVSNFLTDYIDLNGDRYPDIVTEGQLQYTLKTGGLYAPVGRNAFSGNMSTDVNNSWGVSASGSFSKSGKDNAGADGAMPAANGKLMIGKVISKSYADPQGSASISGNYGQGSNNTSRLWADVNGDGLADIITRENNGVNIHLNLGNTNFNSNNLWSSFNLAEGTSQSFGGGIGYNYANGSISAGVSLGRSDSDTQNTLLDINGDGLIDRVNSTNDNIEVIFNRGNKFVDNAVQISDSFDFTNNSTSTNASANVGGTYSMIFPLYLIFFVIPLKIPDVNASVSAGTSTNRTKKSFMDFDGDGYQDFVEEINSNTVRVYHSRIRRTDMLKSVTNPLGGKFTVDYKVQSIDYNNPHAKWTMSSLVIEDNYNKVNDGKDSYRKDFVYENGRYDRRERDFYGYETVKVIDYAVDTNNDPTDVYRTSVSKYHNSSYFLNGLLKESYVIKGDDDTKKYSRSINEYEIKKLNDFNNEIDINEPALPLTFDVGGREGRRTAAVLLTRTLSELYELNSSPQLITEVNMSYDEKGRVIEYKNKGNVANSNDDYTSMISYHDFGNDIINVPSEIKVLVSGITKRKRTTEADANTGRITSIKVYLDTSDFSETIMEYDSYGNLIKITYPGFNNSTMSYDYKYDSVFHKYVTSIADSYGYTSTATYDANFDAILSTVDLAGNEMKYEYDDFGRNILILAPKEKQSGKDYTIKFEYYPYFSTLPSGSTGVNSTNFVPVAVTKHYDSQHPTNDIETYTFIDGLARPIQVKKDIYIDKNNNPLDPAFEEALSISGKTKFDEFGRSIEQFHPYYELKNNADKFRLNEHNSNLSSRTEYDELDRPTKSFDPVGSESSMEYSLDQDVNGIMAIKTRSVVDQGSQDIVNENYKDVFGRVISTMNESPNGDLWTTFEYNAISELLSYTDAEAITTSYEYDGFGRKTSISHPDNGMTTFKYDIASNLISLQTANLANLGQEITYEYYIKRLTAINYPDNPDGSTSISNVVYEYGNSGNETGRLVYQSDASGTQEFQYGNMGEMIHNRRTIVGPTPTMPVRTFDTEFIYDSWNRLQNMIYPDGEKVNFKYDLGGNLSKMSGSVNGNNYEYIQRIDYDYYEQRTYLLYGNETQTFYNYTPELRRLNNLNVKTSNGQDLFNNDYAYDNVGNVTSINNSAGPTINYMGGNYTHNFIYDKLNRITFAEGNFNGDIQQASLGNDYYSDYNMSMQYNDTHGITQKTQYHFKNSNTFTPNTYDNNYEYLQGTHKVSMITNASTGDEEYFSYDENGNLINKATSQGDNRDMLWDESNRLRVLSDNYNSLQHYIYDAAGERILKANSDVEATFENGTILDPPGVTMNNYISYPSAFLVIDENGIYSKHYYAGTQRVVSKIGEEGSHFFDQNGNRQANDSKEERSEESLDYKKLQATQLADLQLYLDKAKMGKAKFKEYKTYTYEEIEEALSNTDGVKAKENKVIATPVYFYHPDHLGTSTFLTDFNGNAYQFFLNLPFGETMAEQKGTEFYQSPYKFNGKELDEETGLYYYGARYYDPKVSVFLSVDPHAEKYTSVGAYVYCINNPINVIDPDGKDIIFLDTGFDNKVKAAYIYSKGNFWLMENKNGKMVKTNKRYNPGVQKVGKDGTMYKLLTAYREIEASDDKVLKKQLKTLEKSKNKHYMVEQDSEFLGAGGSSVVPDDSSGENAKKGISQGTTTTWDLSKRGLDAFKDECEMNVMSMVSHEMQHQFDFEIGNAGDDTGVSNEKNPVEIRATNNENRGRAISGLKPKTTYRGKKIDPKLLRNPPNNKNF